MPHAGCTELALSVEISEAVLKTLMLGISKVTLHTRSPTITMASSGTTSVILRGAIKNASRSTSRRLARRGATVIVSNAYHSDIFDLFRPHQHYLLERNSLLCPDVDKEESFTVAMVFGGADPAKRLSQDMSEFLLVAQRLLETGEALDGADELVELAFERQLFSDNIAGQTPSQIMKAKLSVHIRRLGDDSFFV